MTMRLKKDMPNWVPMYGRKICFSYRGIKKQCNSCFGPHMKKFCKNQRMSLEEYADKFRVLNPYVPEQLYGRLAKLEKIAEQNERAKKNRPPNSEPQGEKSKSTSGGTDKQKPKVIVPKSQVNPSTGITISHQPRVVPQVQVPTSGGSDSTLRINLRRSGDNWSAVQDPSQEQAPKNANASGLSVNSFLNGIKASFRSATSTGERLPLNDNSPEREKQK